MTTWQPTASISQLRQRAELINKIRQFFAAKDILEVETPLLSNASIPDPNIQSFVTDYTVPGQIQPHKLYLQTSPEFAMKRLLAAGSGPIYQVCKAFRNHGESGRFHNPEFTMLEWYRPGFDHHALMTEMDEFFQFVAASQAAEKISYADLFQRELDLNPHLASISELENCGTQHGLQDIRWSPAPSRDDWLMLLMANLIEPKIGQYQPTFVYDFPATQAALARISQSQPPVAQRFEVYWHGIELANGFYELGDAMEQKTRFMRELVARREQGKSAVPVDENLIAALAAGFPDCAGVAVGIDRLLMIVIGAVHISDIISFDVARA